MSNNAIISSVMELGVRAKAAATKLGLLSTEEKNGALLAVAEGLKKSVSIILAENEKDIKKAKENGMSAALIDRLMLNEDRISKIAESVVSVTRLPDPIGEVISMTKRPNGLMIGKKRVPLGVIGMIYESRPNVTADSFCLCFKTGNAVILKGGSDALYSNLAITKVIRTVLNEQGIVEDAIQIIESTDRESTKALMRLNTYVDVLIPRGGAGLIKSVVENSTVPVIETGTGNCHIYVDETADLTMALDIIDNAKTQRLGVCNAAESLVIHQSILSEFLPSLYKRLTEKNITIRADERARAICPAMEKATEEDFYKEYLDRFISLKTVDSLEEAIAHINEHNTGHSEAIVTKDYEHSMRFLNEIDAAAVYVNASTRFTDGGEFGFGAEIGISTQKLHARGPLGLEELTTTKYIIFGNGQIR